MSSTAFPLGSVSQAAYLPDETDTSFTAVPNFSRQIINAIVKPFRSSSKLPPFEILISTKEGLCRGIDSEKAEQEPEMVEKLLHGFCEMKRKKGDSKDLIVRKLGEVEQETLSRHSSTTLESSPPSTGSRQTLADRATAPWSSQRLQSFTVSLQHVRTILNLPVSTAL